MEAAVKQSALRRVAQGVLVGCSLQLALPALAAEPQSSAPLEPRPLARAVEQKLTTLSTASATRFTQDAGSAAAASSQPFFKSPKGIAVLVLMVAGSGYVIYTATNQRLDNPVR
jgi:hypothetical protein